jgi:hypothetical protein
MAREGSHVLGVLTDLAAVLLFFRGHAATSWMRALPGYCHTGSFSPSSFRSSQKGANDQETQKALN